MINFNRLFKEYLSDTPTDLKTVFININFDKGHFTIYPYFFTSAREDELIKDSEWIGSFGGGIPSIVESYDNGEKTTKYYQYEDENESGKYQFLIGKKIIKKPSQFKNKDQEYENFISGVDEYGENIEFSCNHNNLSNYSGANKDNPSYLTPIFFKKEVLAKYYSQTEKYSVDDGGLQCGSMWGLSLDMNNPKYITAYLGDLGRDLPYSEQKYWKSFNITPNGTISKVEFKRSFMAEFTNPIDTVLVFKDLLYKVNHYWNDKYGFVLFKPLNEADGHHYKSFRIPLTNEQKDFDEQLHSLSKMLYDLRSKMTAHRKSDKTFKAELNKHQLLDKDNIDKMEIIVTKINETLNWLMEK